MDRSVLISDDGTTLINRLTNDIDDSTECLGTNGHHNRVSSVSNFLTTDESFSGVESNSTHIVSTQMLRNFEHESRVSSLNLKGVENSWELSFEFDINDGTDDLRNFSIRNSFS